MIPRKTVTKRRRQKVNLKSSFRTNVIRATNGILKKMNDFQTNFNTVNSRM